jgi:hypothetical protein
MDTAQYSNQVAGWDGIGRWTLEGRRRRFTCLERGVNGGGFKLNPPPLQVSRALFDPRLDFTMSGRGLATG